MLSLRAHAHICAGLFAALILVPVTGNLVLAMGTAPPSRAWQMPFMIAYLTLFLAFGLSAIPVIVKTVLRAQEGKAAAAPLIRNQNRIIWAMWLLILAGTAVALPAMIQDGFFSPQPIAAPHDGE